MEISTAAVFYRYCRQVFYCHLNCLLSDLHLVDMHTPTDYGDRVVALFYDDEQDESYRTRGTWMGETGEHGERFELKLLRKDGERIKQFVHKEDIYEFTEDNLEEVPRKILLID